MSKTILSEGTGAGPGRKSAKPIDLALAEVMALPAKRQDAVAEAIFASLRAEADPSARRFQALVEAKYTRGLSAAERSELERLEAGFHATDEEFYRPILQRVKSHKTTNAKRRSA